MPKHDVHQNKPSTLLFLRWSDRRGILWLSIGVGEASQASLRATVFVGDTCRIVFDPAGMLEAETLTVAASLADPPTDDGVEEFVLL